MHGSKLFVTSICAAFLVFAAPISTNVAHADSDTSLMQELKDQIQKLSDEVKELKAELAERKARAQQKKDAKAAAKKARMQQDMKNLDNDEDD